MVKLKKSQLRLVGHQRSRVTTFFRRLLDRSSTRVYTQTPQKGSPWLASITQGLSPYMAKCLFSRSKRKDLRRTNIPEIPQMTTTLKKCWSRSSAQNSQRKSTTFTGTLTASPQIELILLMTLHSYLSLVAEISLLSSISKIRRRFTSRPIKCLGVLTQTSKTPIALASKPCIINKA